MVSGVQTQFVVTSDRKKIVYDHYRSGHKNVVILAHGFFNSRKAVLLKELGEALKSDYDVVILDFRGHGQSEGLFCWTAREHLDLLAVIEEIRPYYARIGIVGFSLGAAASIIAAAQSDAIQSLITVSAPTALEKIEYHFLALDIENDILYNLIKEGRIGKGIRPGPFWLKKDRPIDVVDKIQSPILFLHGAADWIIKPWHAQALYEKTKAKKKLVTIQNGPHAEYLLRKNKNREETYRYIREWFQQTLGPQSI